LTAVGIELIGKIAAKLEEELEKNATHAIDLSAAYQILDSRFLYDAADL